MSTELPLYAQEKRNTCALACLRMVLAAFEIQIEEAALEAAARLEDAGTEIAEIERLARQFGLVAEIEETTVGDLRRILAQGRFPLAYIDRAIFELTPQRRATHSLHDAKIHVVVPVYVSDASVTFHDPLPPRITRKSLRLFQQAHGLLGNTCVICSRPETSQSSQ